MSDRIGFARPSYRTQPATGLDPDMRRMAIVAAGLGGILFLGVGAMSMFHRVHHGIPVIEAQSGPVRIKPADPGGMKIMGADDAAPGAEQLAPPSERPQIAALRARVKAAKTGEAKPDPSLAPAAKVAEAKPTAIVAAPAPQKAAAMSVLPQAAEMSGAGGTSVQLAAFDSHAAAELGWGRLAVKMPELLGMRKPEVVRAELDGRSVWRLRTSGFATLAQAATFCNRMRAHGSDCSIASF